MKALYIHLQEDGEVKIKKAVPTDEELQEVLQDLLRIFQLTYSPPPRDEILVRRAVVEEGADDEGEPVPNLDWELIS